MLQWLLQITPLDHVTGGTLTAYVLFDVLLIIFLARALGTIVARLGQPRVVGEILAGILLGPTLLGQNMSLVIAPADARPVLSVIATLGLIMFMFLAGVEFDSSHIEGRALQAGVLALSSVAVPAILGFPVASLMHTNIYAGPAGQSIFAFAVFIGAALSVTAFPVMAHILMERGELNSPMGALGVATTSIMSVLMFIYIAFAGAVASTNGFRGLATNILLTLLFALSSWFLVRPILARLLPEDETIDGNAMGILFGGMVLYGLIADRIGINALVGGFAWGVILPSASAFRRSVASRVRDVALVHFLPVFFATAGFSTDLKLITSENLPMVAIVLAVAIGAKFLGALPARAFGLSWSEAGVLGTLFNTRGLLVLVAGLIGLQLQIITNLTFTILVVVALVTNLMTLPFLNLLAGLPKPAMLVIPRPTLKEKAN